MVIPLLINTALFGALVYFGVSWLVDFAGDMLPGWLDFLAWILVPGFVVAALMAGFYTFNLVANLVAAPFNGLLAEAVERHLTGRSPPDPPSAAGEPSRGARPDPRPPRCASSPTWRSGRCRRWLLFLVPGVNVVAPFVWMVLGAWMLAVTYVDYPMANHGIGFAELRARLAERRLLSLGFGGAAMAALAVPVLNFLVIPCAVAGATAMWVEQLDDDAPSEPAARLPTGDESRGGRIARR